MFKKLAILKLLKPLTELATELTKVLKDGKKWSLKRSIAGLLTVVCSNDMISNGLNTNNLILAGIVASITFAVALSNDRSCRK